jgi:hypothetical protein
MLKLNHTFIINGGASNSNLNFKIDFQAAKSNGKFQQNLWGWKNCSAGDKLLSLAEK